MNRLLILFLVLFSANVSAKEYTIFVTSLSWHTAIILPSECLPDSLWPENHQYDNYKYLELGWGDRDFYQAPGFNLIYAIKAMLWPTPSAIHVFPIKEFDGSYALNELIEIKLNERQFNDLCNFIISNFEIDQQGKFIPLQEGLYYNSQFFAGSTSYHFPLNSNVWIAYALKASGFNIFPLRYQLTEWLIRKAKKLKDR